MIDLDVLLAKIDTMNAEVRAAVAEMKGSIASLQASVADLKAASNYHKETEEMKVGVQRMLYEKLPVVDHLLKIALMRFASTMPELAELMETTEPTEPVTSPEAKP